MARPRLTWPGMVGGCWQPLGEAGWTGREARVCASVRGKRPLKPRAWRLVLWPRQSPQLPHPPGRGIKEARCDKQNFPVLPRPRHHHATPRGAANIHVPHIPRRSFSQHAMGCRASRDYKFDYRLHPPKASISAAAPDSRTAQRISKTHPLSWPQTYTSKYNSLNRLDMAGRGA